MGGARPIEVLLDGERDAQLVRMAEWIGVERERLAGWLIAHALDEAAGVDDGELAATSSPDA